MPKNAIQALHIIAKPSLLKSASSRLTKFKFETNSTAVWQSAGGASLILPDVLFGLVFHILYRAFALLL